MCSVGGIPAHGNAIPTVHTAAHEVCSSLFSNHFWLFHFQRRRCQVSGKVEKEYKEKTQAEIEEILWEQIKEINKSFPKYKYIKHLIISDEELIKTTTKKIKRGEEMKKILAIENV